MIRPEMITQLEELLREECEESKIGAGTYSSVACDWDSDKSAVNERYYCSVKLERSFRRHITKKLNEMRTRSNILFSYDLDMEMIDGVILWLDTADRNQGYARGLVNIMENFAYVSGCAKVQFDVNLNPEFWTHMGYRQNKKDRELWEKYIL
ncbi:MAG: hypothetical protein ACLFPQ_00745 [Candidatus Woesearchaeota archaeon]